MHQVGLTTSTRHTRIDDMHSIGLHARVSLLNSSDDIEQSHVAVVEKGRRSLLSAPDRKPDGVSTLLAIELQRALERSKYGVKRVYCDVDAEAIYLTGHVRSYFALQMAIHVAIGMACGRRIELRVDVVPEFDNDRCGAHRTLW